MQRCNNLLHLLVTTYTEIALGTATNNALILHHHPFLYKSYSNRRLDHWPQPTRLFFTYVTLATQIHHQIRVKCVLPSIDDNSTLLLVRQTMVVWSSAGGRQGGICRSKSVPLHHGTQNKSQSVQRMVHLHLSLSHRTKSRSWIIWNRHCGVTTLQCEWTGVYLLLVQNCSRRVSRSCSKHTAWAYCRCVRCLNYSYSLSMIKHIVYKIVMVRGL